ncbi:LysR family transcriptional regulator [Enteractinococcus coprophilus]|uniref:DNA-binding transcriptional LysR family regulator n=1 Tax=Enteractinococcus coprophilus TaxID=1027633 RepID=A0A543A0D9_9MICC|nr:LysR family transcriptional regulator [Enteractinococcus coprophilus]TQL66047.1 DNA-binding transcriptional LysR family regulator [Enteractinococcus coprophilus]
MNLEQLESFLTVAETGHFTKAAAQLHIAQPTLSRQISTLEAELGSELFHRARGNITLTAAGETLRPVAVRMLADAEQIRFQMQELAGLRRGRVRLGAPPSMCVSVVAEVVGPYHQDYPGVDLHLRESGSHNLLNELISGSLDMAIVVASEHDPSAMESLDHIPLFEEELVVIASSQKHPGQHTQQLTLQQLAELPQIVFSQSYDLRAATMDAYQQMDLDPNVVLEGAEMDAVLRFVERGLGVAVVPATVLLDRPHLSSSRLIEPSLMRTISLAHRRDVTLSKAAAAMQNLILATVSEVADQSPAIRSLID